MGAGDIRRMKVRADAEIPTEARLTRAFRAEGIGLCCTERMFYDDVHMMLLRAMVFIC